MKKGKAGQSGTEKVEFQSQALPELESWQIIAYLCSLPSAEPAAGDKH